MGPEICLEGKNGQLRGLGVQGRAKEGGGCMVGQGDLGGYQASGLSRIFED